jgi:ADP-ribose pyrophosphatase YjhB (NUDIX family)
MDKDNTQKELYFVAVKVFLEKDGKLLIMKDNFGVWDLPGGRIKKEEFDIPLEQIVLRKLAEELGDVKINFTIPTIFMRHRRAEVVGNSQEAKIFALGYVASLESGEVKMSPRHTELKWVDIHSLKPEEYFTGGWLKGVQDYLGLIRK